MPAPAPGRSTMKLTLTIGMIPLALDVFSAVEDSNVGRSMYFDDGGTLHKVGMTPYDTVTGKNLSRSDAIKMVELPDGELVEVTDDELQGLLSAENGTCTFIGFLPLNLFDYSTEKPYQVRPQKAKGKVNPNDKPFALIMESMRSTETVALLSFVNRGRTRYAAINCDGTMATLRYDEEVREERPLPEVALSSQETSMGETFINTFKLDEAPVFNDEDSQALTDFATTKAATIAAGGTVAVPTAAAPAAAPATDLMALLAASVKS